MRRETSTRLLGALFVMALLSAGCGEVKVAPGNTCQDDEDCSAGEMCIDQRCTTSCRTDADCRESGNGFFCVDDQCTDDGLPRPFAFVVALGDEEPVQNPTGPMSLALDEQLASVPLDASGSLYAGTGVVSYAWSVTSNASGADVVLGSPTSARATLTTPVVFADVSVTLTLIASYPEGNATLSLTLTIRNSVNEPPTITVDAPTAPVSSGQSVTLDATATSDPNGDGLATPFVWTQKEGPSVVLADASGDGSLRAVQFTAPDVDATETLRFELRVADTAPEPAEAAESVIVTVGAGASTCGADADCDDNDVCTTDHCREDGICVHETSSCDDENPCTVDSCGADGCVHDVVDGCCQVDAECADGNPCTDDVCNADNICVHPPSGAAGCCDTAADCDDANTCTVDHCDAAGSCHFELLDGDPCDDGEVCTDDDACVRGVCVGAPHDCDDDEPCTEDVCDDGGACVHTPIPNCCVLDGDCDDGDPCSLDFCAAGSCEHAAIPNCCHVDADCVVEDVCTAGVCQVDTGACSFRSVPGCCRSDGDCGDSDVCTDDSCDASTGVCTNAPVADCCHTSADCDDSAVCTNDRCDPSTGECSHSEISGCCQVTADCDDGNDCTEDDCDAASGVCGHVGLPGCCESADDCDDGDPCTKGTCDEGGSCVFSDVFGCCRSDGDCDDEDECTVDACEGNGCAHAAVPGCCNDEAECDDGDPCTEDSCGSSNHRCSHSAVTDCCQSAADCDDGDVCTTDACAEATGECQHNDVEGCCREDRDCVDDDVCTDDVCDIVNGRCSHMTVADCCYADGDCDDGNVCTSDSCNTQTGACVHDEVAGCCQSASDCDDDDVCTADSCKTTTGECQNVALEGCCYGDGDCDDDNTCTLDVCSTDTHTCVYSGVPECCQSMEDCDDGNACTIDVCDTDTGACGYETVPNCCMSDADCDDGDVCTSEACVDNECSITENPDCCHADADCDDNDVCTQDSCNEETGKCSHRTILGCCTLDAQCDDEDPCTVDTCMRTNTCAHSTISGCCHDDTECLDDNPCSVTACVENGCQVEARPLGSPCTSADIEPYPGVCDNEMDCHAIWRADYPAQLDMTRDSGEFDLTVRSLQRDDVGGTLRAVGSETYRYTDPLGLLLTEQRGAVFSITSDRSWRPHIGLSHRTDLTGELYRTHNGLSVGSAGVVYSSSDSDVDLSTRTLGLSDEELGSFRGVFGGNDSAFCCPESWTLPTVDGRLFRCGHSAMNPPTWFCETLSADVAMGTMRGGPVWGFAYDPNPSDTLFDFRIRETWALNSSRTQRWALFNDNPAAAEQVWTASSPGCAPGAAGCDGLGVWRDIHGVRENGVITLFAVGTKGLVATWQASSGWTRLAIPSERLENAEAESFDWTGVAVSSGYVYISGHINDCLGGRCPYGTDAARTLVLLVFDRDAGQFRDVVTLDTYRCGQLFGLLHCDVAPAFKAEASDVWASETPGVGVWVSVVGSWPVLEDETPEDVRASVWAVHLDL